MHKLGNKSNQRCLDPGTCLTAEPAENRERKAGGGGGDGGVWYPRVVSSYALAEDAHWSRRLDVDVESPDGWPALPTARNRSNRDFYGSEHADAAFLRRRPVSFAIFGKPGMPDDALAAALSAYWGCVHTSLAVGLAAGRADARTSWELRRGRPVNPAHSAAQLVALLGLDDAEIRERGYVLTGLPRYNPHLSVDRQLKAVFATNPPDVIIYLSCPTRDLYDYRNGLILQSTKHKYLTQTLYLDKEFLRKNLRYVRWHRSLVHQIMAEVDVENYENHSLVGIEEIIKQFDPEFVITVDAKGSVNELFATIKEKLMTLPLQRTVLPEIVLERVKSTSSVNYAYHFELNEFDEFESESQIMGTVGLENMSEANGYKKYMYGEANEKIRLMSEFGKLCPVSFYNGTFKLGSEKYCVKFMGKIFYFAGSNELQSFSMFPRRYLEIPRPALPIRAIFYGPISLSGPTAKAVSKFFGYNLIDVTHLKQAQEKHNTWSFVNTIVDSVLKISQEITKKRKDPSSDISNMRNAIGDWIKLYFGNDIGPGARGAEGDASEHEMFEDYSGTQNIDFAKGEQLVHLKNYFESYDMDFMDDLDACILAYDEPTRLKKYFQNMTKKNRSIYRSNFLRENKITQLDLIEVIVENVQTRRKQNNNWIIANAPLDFRLVEQLNAKALNPIQMVFFRDMDPMHKVILSNEKFYYNYRSEEIQKTLKNVKDGLRYGTVIDKMSYPKFVKTKESTPNSHKEDYEAFEEDFEIEGPSEHVNILSHERLMEIITPEITARIHQYTEELLNQWEILKESAKKLNQYIDFNVIECKSDSITNTLKYLIEDTLYYIKKFLSDNVYDISKMNIGDVEPTVGKYDGDTSIYCPVSFKNGKLSIGSKKYMAIYQNRYYFLSSSINLRAFISNPNQYSLFTTYPKFYPKPKVTLLHSFGFNVVDLIDFLSNTFDLTLIDSYKLFKENLLPKNTPMLGKMYEEPALKHIMDTYFVSEDQKDYINSLRKYVDGESAYLNEEDWAKMNSIFSQTNEGICCTNFPRSLIELQYLHENEMNPDIFIEVVGDERDEHDCAKKAVITNWLVYYYKLMEKIISRDSETRQNTNNKRSILFKNKLAEIIMQRKSSEVKRRLESIINIMCIAAEHGPDTIKYVCDTSGQSEILELSLKNVKFSSHSAFSPKRLTLKQKKIIIYYELNKNDFCDLDDFSVLEKIDEIVNNELPEGEFLLSKCFSNSLEFPSDTMIEQYLKAEKSKFESMRKYAESVNIQWITVPPNLSQSTVRSDISKVLANKDKNFETTFDVDLKTSENMLSSGEVYLSKFGRWCPVQVYEKPIPIQRFFVDCADGRIQPVVHRKYVYYLSGLENLDKFKQQPLKYISQPFTPLSNIPLKIAVLGPPKSGKSYYARRLCAQYGFQLVQIEEVVESYLSTYKWTDDSKSATRKLYQGDVLNDITLVDIVKSAIQSARAMIQGFVLDGFPMTEKQFKIMNNSGIILHKVFYLNRTYEMCSRNNERSDKKIPAALLRLQYENWSKGFVGEEWISEHFDNVTVVNNYDKIETAILTCLKALRDYQNSMRKNKPCRLENIPVTKRESIEKKSLYLDQCPVCRVNDNCFNRPQDMKIYKQNLVQYKFYLYWICPKHYNLFSNDPKKYVDLTPDEPEQLPIQITEEELKCNPYVNCKRFNKFCIVCALSCLWKPIYRRGNKQFMITYCNYKLVLCSSECQNKFMQRPFYYTNYRMHVSGPEESSLFMPKENFIINNLPTLGYLEQTIAVPTSSALVKLTAMKPIYPGLSVEKSAMVFLGLYIGMNGSDDDINEYYRNAFRQFVNTCNDYKIKVYKLKLLT